MLQRRNWLNSLPLIGTATLETFEETCYLVLANGKHNTVPEWTKTGLDLSQVLID